MTEVNKTQYTFADLVKILKTEPENVSSWATRSNFAKIVEINGKQFVTEENLEEFFDSYVSFHKIELKSHEITDDLKNLSNPWATTLVEMYHQRFAFPASVAPSQGQLLKSLICNLNPSVILEIGCFIGVSTIWMASGLEQIRSNGVIHSVDLFDRIMPWAPYSYGYLKNPFDFAQKSAQSAQLSHRINFHMMDSAELGERYSEIINKPIDFLYIDGDHSIHGCVNDFVLFYPHVPVGGYIMLHDIYPEHCGWDGPRYIIDNFIKKSPHFSLVEITTTPRNFGMALIRKLGEDRNFHPGGNLTLELNRAKAKLRKTSMWQNIRETVFGKLIKKTLS